MKPMFPDSPLYAEALTHRSWAHEHGGPDYERLEHLGDAVLQLCVTEALVRDYPTLDEGQLTAARQRLVDEPALAPLAVGLGLHTTLRLGAGASRDGTRDQPRVQAALFEALLGAVYLDAGLDAARALVREHVLPGAAAAVAGLSSGGATKSSFSPVTLLQEWSQKQHHGLVPAYDELAAEGPDHERQYQMRVRVDGEILGEGWGSSKPRAKAAAAAAALDRLGVPR